MPTRKPRVRIDLQAKLKACGHWITATMFDRTGERMAFASGPLARRREEKAAPSREVRVWVARVRDGAILHELVMPTVFAEHPELPEWPDDLTNVALDFSPDGTTLAVSWDLMILQNSECGALALFDLERGVMVAESLLSPCGALCFSPDSRLLAVATRTDYPEAAVSWFERDRGWRSAPGGPPAPGTRAAFSPDGKQLLVVDTEPSDGFAGVAFLRAAAKKVSGRSSPVKLLLWDGPLVVAPDGKSALGKGTVWQGGLGKRHQREGVWRWRQDAAPERIATIPGANQRETRPESAKRLPMRFLWIDPEGRELLWVDRGELVRQRAGDHRLERIPLASKSARLKDWSVEISPDGQRLARIKDDQVVFTRLRRSRQAPG